MNSKLLLCLALVLSGGFILSCAAGTDVSTTTNASAVKMVSPQGSVDLPKLGRAIFREQASGFSLQVPVGSRENGNRTDTNNPVLQVWLLRADGAVIPQLDQPSMISIGSMGNYATDFMFYRFEKVPVNELAGVVVSLNGKLYCHEIELSK